MSKDLNKHRQVYGVVFGYVLKHWIEYKIKQKEDE